MCTHTRVTSRRVLKESFGPPVVDDSQPDWDCRYLSLKTNSWSVGKEKKSVWVKIFIINFLFFFSLCMMKNSRSIPGRRETLLPKSCGFTFKGLTDALYLGVKWSKHKANQFYTSSALKFYSSCSENFTFHLTISQFEFKYLSYSVTWTKDKVFISKVFFVSLRKIGTIDKEIKFVGFVRLDDLRYF